MLHRTSPAHQFSSVRINQRKASGCREHNLRRLLPILIAVFGGVFLTLITLGGSAAGASSVLTGTSTGSPAVASLALPDQPNLLDAPLATTDLQVKVLIDKDKVRPGDPITYTMYYTNATASTIADVMITSTLSKWQSYDGNYTANPAIPAGQFTFSGNDILGYTLRWSLGTLAASAKGSIVLHTQVLTDHEPSISTSTTLIGNAAEIKSTPHPEFSSGTANAAAMLVGPLLEVDKTSKPTNVMPGYLLYYTLTVKNYERADSIPATNIVVSDVMPENSTVYAIGSGGSYVSATNHILWNLVDPLAPGATKNITFTVRINPDTGSGATILNHHTEYSVRSAELHLSDVLGKRDVNNKVESVLKKTALAKRMSGTVATVYPGDEVTYTLTVYNPLTTTLTGVVVTDTLPGNPIPFTYKRTANGSLPPEQMLENNRKLVWTLDLPGLGSASRSFVVQVPYTTIIPTNQSSANFYNALAAIHPEAYFSTETQLAVVTVEAPLVLDKSVSPNHGQPGETVIYTITLNNRGPYLVNNIRLTDTLPAYFEYVRMVNGPDPEPAYLTNPVVWTGLYVEPKTNLKISFVARIDGVWLATYQNALSAYSPVVYIPNRTNMAGVKVDPPLGLNKTVSPTQTFVNTNVGYQITVTNQSTVSWKLAKVTDYLPTGFYQVGGSNSNPAVIDLDPEAEIIPGGSWSGSFDALVSTDIGCAQLPKTFPNKKDNIQISLTSPYTVVASNAQDLAPLLVKPNLLVDLVPYRQTVRRSDLFTYTLVITNISSAAAVNSQMSLNLPTELIYLSTTAGRQPTSISGTRLNWDGITILPGEVISAQLSMQVSASSSYGTKSPSFSGLAQGVCFGLLGTGYHSFGDGKVSVTDYVLLLAKEPVTTRVAPLALVDYDIKIQNQDAYPYLIDILTDTLPAGFAYYSVVSGPDPAEVNGNQVIWRNVLAAGRTNTVIRVRLQASALYGSYINSVSGYTSKTPVKDPLSVKAVDVSPVFDLLKTAPITQAGPGDIIPYTITLVNLSQTPYTQIRVTDTLPTGFTYLQMKPGYPAPSQLGPGNTEPVWSGLSVGSNCGMSGCRMQLAFEVKIGAQVGSGVYYNQVIGYSPSGSIPGPLETAPVTVTSPVFANLLVDLIPYRQTVRPGDRLTYTLVISNPSTFTVSNAQMDLGLPDGFSYVSTPSGTPPSSVVGGHLTWTGAVITASQTFSSQLLIQVSSLTSLGTKTPNFSGFASGASFGAPGSGGHPYGDGKVTVVDYALLLTKAPLITRVPPLTLVDFDIHLQNLDAYTFTVQRVTDTLPGGFVYYAMLSGPQPAVSGDQLIWSDLVLPGKSTVTLRVRTQAAAATGSYTNAVAGYCSQTPVKPPASVTPVVVANDFELSKIAGVTQANPGGVVPYTITLLNLSQTPYAQVRVTDTLPSGFTYLQTRAGYPAPTQLGSGNSEPVWSGLSLPANCGASGCSLVLAFEAQISPQAAEHTYYNRIMGSSPSGPIPGPLEIAPVTVTRQVTSSLLVDLIPYRQTVRPGDLFTYTLVISNVSAAAATNAQLDLTLPADISYQSTTGGQPPTSVAGGHLTWTGVSIAAGGQFNVQMIHQVSASAAAGTKTPTFSGTAANASFGALGSGYHPYGDGKVAVVDYVLVLSKAPLSTRVPPLSLVDFDINLQNLDAYPFTVQLVTDTLPAGFTYYAMLSGPEPVVSGDWVVWSDLVVPAKSTLTLRVRTQAAATAGSYTNAVAAYCSETPVEPPGSVAAVVVANDFELSKTAGIAEAQPGDIIPYTITLVNLSQIPYTQIRVTDTLPTGFTFLLMKAGYPAPTQLGPGNTQPVWSGLSLAASCGASGCRQELPFEVQIGDQVPTHVYYNQVIGSSPSGAIPGPLQTAPVTVTNPNQANLLVDLIPYRQTVRPGDSFTYTLMISNPSAIQVSNAQLELTLPADLAYLSSISGPPPSQVSGSLLTWTGVSIPPSQSTSAQILIQVSAQASLGTKTPAFDGSAANASFGALGSGGHAYGDGKVEVVDYVLMLSKAPLTRRVPPLTLVDFDIHIQNLDAYTFALQSVTDTLPAGFTYSSMVSGPEPAVDGNQVIWSNLSVPGKSTLTLRVRLQAAAETGSYTNAMAGYCVATPVKPPVGVTPVEVADGIFALGKTTSIAHTYPGTILPYTITLINLSQTPYTQIRVTDTLPAGFSYFQMRSGYPTPSQLGQGQTQPVWEGLSLGANCGAAGCQLELAFEVRLDSSLITGTYTNTVVGASPSGPIPGPLHLAPVYVTPRPPYHRPNPVFMPLMMEKIASDTR